VRGQDIKHVDKTDLEYFSLKVIRFTYKHMCSIHLSRCMYLLFLKLPQ